ncbi:MAG: hypothetical protein ACLUD0_09780 [Eubacterium ramulus]
MEWERPLLAAVIDQEVTLLVANVGDSRLYIVGDRSTQITEDHSLVQEMVRLGKMDRGECQRITRIRTSLHGQLGHQKEVKIDIFERQVQAGEYIVLCSDGLTNMVEDSVSFFKILHGTGKPVG